jgi:uncharacterized protein (DUF488 family)
MRSGQVQRVEGSGMEHPFYTIGHSTHPIDEFIALLHESGIRCVVDVRTVPRSRSNPRFNADVLARSLAQSQIGYEPIAALGGLRGHKKDVPAELNGFWQNQSFHNYADYAMGAEFHAGLARLRELGHAQPCAIMCAEAVWWRCHRRIIADYLIMTGETVIHILGPGHAQPASVTSAARPQPDGILIYPLAA